MRIKSFILNSFLVSLMGLLSLGAGAYEKLPQLYFHVPQILFQPLGPVGATKKEVIDAQNQLRKEAKKMDADAVVGVKCDSGGLKREGLTWARHQAHCRGIAVNFIDEAKAAESAPEKKTQEPVEQISVSEFKQLKGSEKGIQILDVREDWEVKKAKIPGSVQIPMDSLSKALKKLDKDQPVVTYCHHGGRSQRAARALIEMGFSDVKFLQGGIDAYSLEVDSSIPRY